jgi:hypothetical protein
MVRDRAALRFAFSSMSGNFIRTVIAAVAISLVLSESCNCSAVISGQNPHY